MPHDAAKNFLKIKKINKKLSLKKKKKLTTKNPSLETYQIASQPLLVFYIISVPPHPISLSFLRFSCAEKVVNYLRTTQLLELLEMFSVSQTSV